MAVASKAHSNRNGWLRQSVDLREEPFKRPKLPHEFGYETAARTAAVRFQLT